ncbi:MAG: DUF4299 family protein [Bacteroidales bacterium]|nr:DUF4299 family protein [Bacteroidales bacterium]
MDEYDRMVEFDKIGDGPVVVYDRDHIGRGVQIEELSKKQVKLSLPLPATTYDINVLYYLARRAAELWGNNVIIDPDWENRISLDDIDTPKKADYGSSIKILASWPSSDPGPTCLPCALFPICIESKTLEAFGSETNYDAFAQYLHERQKIDAYYTRGLLTSLPDMEGISSLYVLIDQGICILPFKPKDFYRDGDDVKECDDYLIAYWHGENLLKMEYDVFLEKVSTEKKKPFDASHWQLSAMSKEELVAIFNSR